nr:ATP-dependent DNA helicase PIF4-like [Tanacetum cinerariifolium]
MQYPDQEYTMAGYNRLIFDETSHDIEKLKEQHATWYESLTTKQKGIYSTVMNAIDNNKGGMFFVYGYGGIGKTYLYKTMLAALRSKGEIVMNVALRSIATLLFEGGRMTHSLFAIPINVVEDSMCHIDIGNGKASGANDDQSTVVFPYDMLIYETDDDVGAIIDDTYLDLLRNLWNPSFFQEKSILAPTHEMIDIINQRMLTMLIGDEKEYESSDSV